MTVPTTNVLLYAADPVDYQLALFAAATAGIPPANVIGNFYQIWNDTASGTNLVIAVGGPANDALYYNPCGWSNPAGSGAGTTPFSPASAPLSIVPGANLYESAAGANRYDTLKLATMDAYYAVYGTQTSGNAPRLTYQSQPACRR